MSTVLADRFGGRIKLACFPNRETVQRIERVNGARLVEGEWTFPLALTVCYELREAFGPELNVGPGLDSWARTAIEEQNRMGALAAMTDAELINSPERVAAAMASRTYQRVGARFIADGGSVLVADQQGLGKTIEVLAGLAEAHPGGGHRYLIFAPLIAVTAVWPGEIAHWLGAESALVAPIVGDRAQRQAGLASALSEPLGGRDLYVIVNIEMARIIPNPDASPKYQVAPREYVNPDTGLRRDTGALFGELFTPVWDAIVVDESHKALIKGSKPTQTRHGMMKLKANMRVATSGTPMRGKPTQMWGTLNWLRPDLYTNYWAWVAQYWDVSATKYSAFNIGEFLPGGIDRLALDLRSIMLRRTKGEVLPELPAKSYAGTYLIPGDDQSPHGIWLDASPAQIRQLDQLESDGVLTFPGGGEIICTGHLALRTRQLQIANAPIGVLAHPVLPCPKLDWLIELLDSLGIRGQDDDGEAKIVIAAQSTRLIDAVDAWLRQLGIESYKVTGNTPSARRAPMVEHFQSSQNDVRVFLLNTKAGGTAITLDAADDLVLLDESTIPDEQEQVEDRIHRTSRLHQVTIHPVRTLGTLEEEIAWIAAAREDVQKYILDGSRGVEYAKQVYLDSRRLRG